MSVEIHLRVIVLFLAHALAHASAPRLHLRHHFISAGHHDDSSGKNDGEGDTSEIDSDEDGIGHGERLILKRLRVSGFFEEDRLREAWLNIAIIHGMPLASVSNPIWDHLGELLVVNVFLCIGNVLQEFVSGLERAIWLRISENTWVGDFELSEPSC